MLMGFQYRYKTERMRGSWDAGFARGSLVAALLQGMMVGALVGELPISNGRHAGGEFTWFRPFAVLYEIGPCLVYALLGTCWLVKKSEGDVRGADY